MINLKIKIVLLVICVLGLNYRPALANNSETRYVKISTSDYDLLKRQSLLNFSILKKIKDLETLYKQIKEIVDSFTNTMKTVKKILNIQEDDVGDTIENQDFKHVSGTMLSPGFVIYEAETYDKKSSFDTLGIESLEMDVYYNKKLFTIDHIEGDQVIGEEFKKISLPASTRATKDRIELPLSDVLVSKVIFKIFFAPINPATAKVGNKTLVDIRYFKRPINDIGGVVMPAISYNKLSNTQNYVQIKSK
jgi:hypothetical protein